MRVERVGDATEFLRRTLEFRAADPVLTNVIGSVAEGVRAGRQYAQEFWWLVWNGGDELAGCAIRTAPWNLAVSSMSPAAAAALGEAVGQADPDLPGVNGPRGVVDAVVGAFGSAVRPRRVAATVRMTDLVHVLGNYVPPPPVPGAARRARADEAELLVAWHEQFGVDAGLPVHDPRTTVQMRITDPGIWFWVVDGEPVAMAGYAPLVETPAGVVGRIGPVYTPQPWRRRGFGAAVTAAVVELLLPRCSTIMLYADAANPTSNGVYARLGFRPVAEIVEMELKPNRD